MRVAAIQMSPTLYFAWVNITPTFCATLITFKLYQFIRHYSPYTNGYFTHSFIKYLTIFSHKLRVASAMAVLPCISRMSTDAPLSSTSVRTTLREPLVTAWNNCVWLSLYGVLQTAPSLVSNLNTGSSVLNIAACRRVGKKPI